MRRTCVFLLIVAAAILQATPANAQGIRFQVTPFGGGAIFASNLTDAFFLVDEAGNTVVFDDSELETAFAVGLHAGGRKGRLAIEGTFAYVPTDFSGFTESQPIKFDTNLLLYGGDILYYFANPHSVEPYIAFGLGGKHYDVDVEDAESVSDFTWNVGFGISFPLSEDLSLRVEMRDYMSTFNPELPGIDSGLQNDFLLTAGIGFGFGGKAPEEPAEEPSTADSTGGGCGEQTSVQSTSMDGSIVTLADGSVWEIEEEYRRSTMLWLPQDIILPCADNLVDPSTGAVVEARKLK
jgi:opacity protein-like surface antigen